MILPLNIRDGINTNQNFDKKVGLEYSTLSDWQSVLFETEIQRNFMRLNFSSLVHKI